MKSAFKYIQPITIDFLYDNISKLSDYKEANKILVDLSGIDSFFRKQEDFLTLLNLLKSGFKISDSRDRREYGDFQTPYTLTESICSFLSNEGILPDIIIEPTFGKGSFLISALKHFPTVKKVYGVEIYESYYWMAKFSIIEIFLINSNFNKPKISLHLEDIFKFNFKEIIKSVGNYYVLVLGNPPWVTNSELSILNSKNLPPKSNLKSLNGLDAITGKGNFDISEYIIIMMVNLFSKYNGHLAMLAKNSVIRNFIFDLPKTNHKINDIFALTIDAKKYFNASVKASLFKCRLNQNKFSFTCKTLSFNSPTLINKEFGWYGNKFVSDVNLYKKNVKYDGICPYVWRQGVKHDCSKIMELYSNKDHYVNGFKKELDLEKELIYSLLKSSDLDSLVITKPRKHVIITQKKIGEDTYYLSKFPKLYQYLTESKHYFEQRKSRIYNDKPSFSIFGIGDYSFKLYKVAISGLYKRSTFSLILPENEKPVMLDDTCYFLGFDYISESIFVWAILNSEHVQQLLAALTFLDAKRPYTKDLLMRIDIDKVANDMAYDQIRNQVKSLDEKLLFNITKEKWDGFREKINKRKMENKYSLIKSKTNQVSLQFS